MTTARSCSIPPAALLALAAAPSAAPVAPAERVRLFTIADYPLAWGDRKVKADAFLTGVVKVPADMGRVTVVIEAFAAAAPATTDTVAEFSADADRGTLRDLGRGFALSPR